MDASPIYKLGILAGVTAQKYTFTFNIVKAAVTTLQTLTDIVWFDTYSK